MAFTVDTQSGRPMDDGATVMVREASLLDAVRHALVLAHDERQGYAVLAVGEHFYTWPLARSGAFSAHVAYIAS